MSYNIQQLIIFEVKDDYFKFISMLPKKKFWLKNCNLNAWFFRIVKANMRLCNMYVLICCQFFFLFHFYDQLGVNKTTVVVGLVIIKFSWQLLSLTHPHLLSFKFHAADCQIITFCVDAKSSFKACSGFFYELEYQIKYNLIFEWI